MGMTNQKEERVMQYVREFMTLITGKEGILKSEKGKIHYYSILCDMKSFFGEKKSKQKDELLRGSINYLLLLPSIAAKNKKQRMEIIKVYCQHDLLRELAAIYSHLYHKTIENRVIELFLIEIMKEEEAILIQLLSQIYCICSDERKMLIQKILRERLMENEVSVLPYLIENQYN